MTPNFLAPGVGLLLLSLLSAVLGPHDGGVRSQAFVAWLTNASLFLGIVFVGAHLVQEIVRKR